MSVLPIVDRELRVTARRSGTYWMRCFTASAMLSIWVVLLTKSHSVAATQMGQHLLNGLGILALVFSMLSGVFLTSDCLSEEKREGTLGLLFLTDLKAYDVVLGKLAANSLHAFFGVLAVFPVLGLTLLIGGVTGLEFARLILVFVVTLFFSLSMGLVASAVNREAKRAVMHAFLLIMVFAGLFPVLWWFQWLLFRGVRLHFLLWSSPGHAYLHAFDVAYRLRSGAREFWSSMGTLFALGLGGIVFANTVLPRSWQEDGNALTAKARSKRTGALSKKATTGFRPGVAWFEPMYWLAARDGSPRLMARRLLMVLVPVWLAMLLTSVHLSTRTGRVEAFISTMCSAYALHLLVKVLIATEAGRRMNQDRRSGAWELLLVTPVEVKAILKGQKRALHRHFQEATIILLLLNLIMLATVWVFPQRLDIQPTDRQIFVALFLGGMLTLATDCYGLSWGGMWCGLRAKKNHRGVMATLALIMSVPLLFIFFLIFLQPSVGDTMAKIIMGIWFVTGMAVSLLAGWLAKWRLLKRFRSEVLDSHGADLRPVTARKGA